MEKTILESDALLMRPFEASDIDEIPALVVAPEIADNTFVPRPYPEEAALEFVRLARERWKNDEAYVFAIIDKSISRFVGCMGIHPVREHNRAEVGYWIGKPYWGKGLATGALRLLIGFGFDVLKLNRIEAGHFDYNPASGRVLLKANMRYEGERRGFVLHRDQYKDVRWYAILREEYAADRAASSSEKTKETAED